MEAVLIKLKPIAEIVELALWTGWIARDKPVSVLLAAPVEAGKTMAVLPFMKNPGVRYINDFTPMGFCRDHQKDMETGDIRHLIVPDLVTPLSRGKASQSTFTAFLNGLIEEGQVNISTMFIRVQLKVPHAMGIIGAITKDMLYQHRPTWEKTGFISRLLPVTWSYTEETIENIGSYMGDRGYSKEPPRVLIFPSEPVEISLPKEHARELWPTVSKLARATNLYGFRYQRQFQCLAMAHALRAGRSEVQQADIDRVLELSAFINLDFKAI